MKPLTNPINWRRTCLVGTITAVVSLGALPAWAQNAARVVLQTSAGDITIELNAAKAPKSADNFLQYVKDKHYDGTIFHRVMDGFMIQGGGFTADMNQKPTRGPIPLEASNGLRNDRGTVAMARTGHPHSATSQFFINVVDNAGLNAPSPDGYGYTVFGKVIDGMDTVDKIRKTATGSKGGHQNVPLQNIIINTAKVIN
jgi:peptidyl-prolyl cis-trans isomerase A (cyclophilin A)